MFWYIKNSVKERHLWDLGRLSHLVEHWRLSLYDNRHVHLWNKKPKLRTFLCLLYYPDGSYLALPHTVTPTILYLWDLLNHSVLRCLHHGHLASHSKGHVNLVKRSDLWNLLGFLCSLHCG